MPAWLYNCHHCGPFKAWHSVYDLHLERCLTCGSQHIWLLGEIPPTHEDLL